MDSLLFKTTQLVPFPRHQVQLLCQMLSASSRCGISALTEWLPGCSVLLLEIYKVHIRWLLEQWCWHKLHVWQPGNCGWLQNWCFAHQFFFIGRFRRGVGPGTMVSCSSIQISDKLLWCAGSKSYVWTQTQETKQAEQDKISLLLSEHQNRRW